MLKTTSCRVEGDCRQFGNNALDNYVAPINTCLPVLVGGPDVFQNPVNVGHTRGWVTIGQENDDRRRVHRLLIISHIVKEPDGVDECTIDISC